MAEVWRLWLMGTLLACEAVVKLGGFSSCGTLLARFSFLCRSERKDRSPSCECCGQGKTKERPRKALFRSCFGGTECGGSNRSVPMMSKSQDIVLVMVLVMVPWVISEGLGIPETLMSIPATRPPARLRGSSLSPSVVPEECGIGILLLVGNMRTDWSVRLVAYADFPPGFEIWWPAHQPSLKKNGSPARLSRQNILGGRRK